MPPLALLFGGVSLVSALFAAFVLGIDAFSGGSRIVLPQPPSAEMAASLAEATSLEAIRKSCIAAVQIHDSQRDIIRALSAHNAYLFGLLLRGVLFWGAITGLGFLYVYFASRSHVLRGQR